MEGLNENPLGSQRVFDLMVEKRTEAEIVRVLHKDATS